MIWPFCFVVEDDGLGVRGAGGYEPFSHNAQSFIMT